MGNNRGGDLYTNDGGNYNNDTNTTSVKRSTYANKRIKNN